MATHHFLLRSDCWHCLQLPQSILLPQPARALIPIISLPHPLHEPLMLQRVESGSGQTHLCQN